MSRPNRFTYALKSDELVRHMIAHPPEGNTCLEWPRSRDKDGYGKVYEGGKHRRAHCVAFELAYGPVPDGMWVLHKCDNPPCFRPDHLFAVTGLDNQRDCHAKGRAGRAKGSAHGGSLLDEEIVAEIRHLHYDGLMNGRHIAQFFGITPQMVSTVLSGKFWTHV